MAPISSLGSDRDLESTNFSNYIIGTIIAITLVREIDSATDCINLRFCTTGEWCIQFFELFEQVICLQPKACEHKTLIILSF